MMTATDVPDRGVTLHQDERGRYHVTYDYVLQKEVSVVIVLAVSTIESVDALDLPSLSETVDLDALDALVRDTRGNATVEIRFEYAGYEICVTTTGEIRLIPGDESGYNPA